MNRIDLLRIVAGALQNKIRTLRCVKLSGRAVSEPGQILKTLGEPRLSGIQTLYRSDTLTILNVLWGPGMTLYPHDHRMWAVIRILQRAGDNSFYHRSESGLQAHHTKTLNLRR